MHKKRIFKFFRSTVSVALAVSLMLSGTGTSIGTVYASGSTQLQQVDVTEEAVVSEEPVNSSSSYGLADNIQDGTILHCFNWKYNDIKAELANIAAAGFTSVQTSPAQRDDTYGVWYMLYQPQSFSVATNALGTKEELQSLCEEAENYGIKVIVDVVANHMRGDGYNVDDNMSRSNHPDYYRTGNRDSNTMSGSDWENRNLVITCNIGMQDLVSEKTEVQNVISNYIKELQGIGVDGIRWDAAKHIGLPSEGCNFWKTVTSQGLYHYGEILEGPDDRKSGNEALMKEYTDYMSVTDNGYGSNLCGNFRDGSVISDNGKWVNKNADITADKLVYWGESHDTYANDTNDGGWTKYIDQNAVDRAYAIAGSRAGAAALYFSRPFEKEKEQIKAGVKGSTHFTSKEVAAVNHLHNACIGEKEYYVGDTNSNVAAVCRESGAVIVLGSGGNRQVTVTNGGGLTKPGTYTDEISGSTWTVTSSTISGTVGDSGIAVIYDQTTPGPSVSASVSDGASFTTDTLDVTFTIKNAASATYSVDGGAATSFTNSTKLTLGADTAFGSTVKVKITVTGEDGSTVEKTFTYTKKEAGKVEKNTVYFTKPSSWSGAYIYAYVPGTTATKITGEWPGTAMTSEGDGVYSYTFADTVTEAKVIFAESSSGQQTPVDVIGQACGYDYTSGKAYTCIDNVWTAITVPDPTPTSTVTPEPTEAPSGIKITSSLPDGSSFQTETKTITLTLENAQKGTYCVDDGPVKEFTGSADVVIGKGKIADSTVTVKVTAEGNGKTAEETFSYRKEFLLANDQPAKNTGAEEEAVVEETEINALSAAETAGIYATNPNGNVGKKASITIDGSFSDWSEDMLIAQGAACDTAPRFKGCWENWVMDSYSLYGAWDDENLYIAWQNVNVYDTFWAQEGNGPLSDRGKCGDAPVMIAINTGKGNTMTGRLADGKGIWGMDVTFETRIDNLLVLHSDLSGEPGLFTADASGFTSYAAADGLLTSFKDAGIEVKVIDDCFPSTIMGVWNPGDENDHASYDLSNDWVDMKTTTKGVRTHDTAFDTFYEMKIPFSVLGITKEDVEQNGIGVMQLIGRGESGIDCVPHDPSMLDNTYESYGAEPSNSHEKDDADIITVPLANIGKAGDIPVVTNTPTPTVTATPTPTTEVTTTPTTVPGGELSVNFGADRSAPQYNTTALEIKAIANGGKAPYNYEFFVDDMSVQNGENDTYTWQNGSTGAHTIKVIVTDSENKTVTIEKEYDLEQDADTTPIPTVTVQPTVSPTPVITNEPTSTAAPTPTKGGSSSNLTVTKFNVSCLTTDGRYKIGDTYVMTAEVTGAQGTPQYMFTYILNGEEVIVKNYDSQSEARFVATEPGKYTFKVYVVDDSNDKNPEFEVGEIEIFDADITIVPTITTGPDITITPNPDITEKPVVTNTPIPTSTPIVTKAPTATVKPITAAPKPTATTAPKKGDKVTVSKATYKITATGSTKAVEYARYTGTSTTVNIPSTVKINGVSYKVTSVSDKALKGNTKLKVVKIPANVTKIGKEAFYGCTNLWKVKSGVNVTSIGSKAFYNCKKLSSITMSKKLTTIGSYAFYKCTSLKKITLNSKVSKIGSKAFYGCKNLKEISVKTKKLTSKNVGSKAFKGINSKATIKTPSSKLTSYKKILKSKGVSSTATIKKL